MLEMQSLPCEGSCQVDKLTDSPMAVVVEQAMRAKPTAAAAAEAMGVFAPLANRLGVWSIKADLEDLAFMVSAGLSLSY